MANLSQQILIKQLLKASRCYTTCIEKVSRKKLSFLGDWYDLLFLCAFETDCNITKILYIMYVLMYSEGKEAQGIRSAIQNSAANLCRK